MEKLPDDVRDYISITKGQFDAAMNYIDSEDWSKMEEPLMRNMSYQTQKLFVEKNMKFALNLSKTAMEKGLVDHKDIKECIEMLLSIFTVHEKRYDFYTKEYSVDLLIERKKKLIDSKKVTKKALDTLKSEITFGTTITFEFLNLRGEHRSVLENMGEGGVNISTRSDIPIPLAMRELAEDRFPKIKEYLKNTAEDGDNT